MSIVTELLDRLPTPDGGLRRRFTAGLLFSIITLVGIYWLPGIPALALTISEAAGAARLKWTDLNSAGMMIILFGIVFLVGNLIDVISYVFLNRVFFLFGGTIAYRGIQVYYQSLFSKKADILSLSETERATYEELPEYVQHGLRDPYRRQFEVAFRYLIHISPDDEKTWLHQLDSRNKNLFSVISSSFLAMLLLVILAFSVEFASSRTFGSELSNEQRDCYTELVDALRRLTIVDSTEALSLYAKIGEGSFSVTRDIEFILESEDYNKSMTEIRKRTAMDDKNDPTIVFGRCVKTHTDGQDTSTVPWRLIVVSLVIFLFVLSSLAVTYALTLRNSISSALEMLQLRRIIEFDSAESDIEPSSGRDGAHTEIR